MMWLQQGGQDRNENHWTIARSSAHIHTLSCGRPLLMEDRRAGAALDKLLLFVAGDDGNSSPPILRARQGEAVKNKQPQSRGTKRSSIARQQRATATHRRCCNKNTMPAMVTREPTANQNFCTSFKCEYSSK